jgi:hypothetical protein
VSPRVAIAIFMLGTLLRDCALEARVERLEHSFFLSPRVAAATHARSASMRPEMPENKVQASVMQAPRRHTQERA